MSLRDLLDDVVEISLDDERYPTGLLDLSRRAPWIRVLGSLPDFSRSVAIVGTRRADEEAIDFAYALAGDLARRGFVVVSGGALGIDRAAHEGALHAGGKTTVVLPTGFADAYPAVHHSLFREVITSGCLLTETDEDASAQPSRFLSRNRLIAALGRSTIVVQAPSRSGALSTAGLARALGRPVFAVPAAPWDYRGQGCLALLRSGSRVCAGARDILSIPVLEGETQAVSGDRVREKSSDLKGLSKLEQQVYQSLQGRPMHPDEVSRRTGIAVWEVQRSMLRLVLAGWVDERPGGRYCLHPKDKK